MIPHILLRLLAICSLFGGGYTAYYVFNDSLYYESYVMAFFGFIWGCAMTVVASGVLVAIGFCLKFIFAGTW